MIKKISIAIFIILILIIGFIFCRPLIAEFTRNQDILNFYKNHKFNNISVETIDQYEKLKNKVENNNYKRDVSPIIKDYVKTMLYAIENYVNYTEISLNKIEVVNDGELTIEYLPNDLTIYMDPYYTPFTQEDVDLYYKRAFENNLIDKLLNTPGLEHNSDNISMGWEIDTKNFEDEIVITLPYNHTLTYYERKYEWTDREFISAEISNDKKSYSLRYKELNSDEINTLTGLDLSFDHSDYFHQKDMTLNATLLLKNPGDAGSFIRIKYNKKSDYDQNNIADAREEEDLNIYFDTDESEFYNNYFDDSYINDVEDEIISSNGEIQINTDINLDEDIYKIASNSNIEYQEDTINLDLDFEDFQPN